MTRWHNCPNIAAFWCNGISLVIYLYVIYTAAIRYKYWKNSSLDPRYGFLWNQNIMLFYLSCVVTSSLLWILVFYSSIFKTGNQANDYINLRKSILIVKNNKSSTHNKYKITRVIERIKYHLMPFNSLIHVITAYILVMPLSLMIQEEINHDVVEETPSLHHIMSTYFPEFINLALSIIILTVRAPSSFVSTSPLFSIIFSVHIFLAGFALISNCITQMRLAAVLGDRFVRVHPFITIAILVNTCCFLHEAGRNKLLSSLGKLSLPSSYTMDSMGSIQRYMPSVLSFTLLLISLSLHVFLYQPCQKFSSILLADIFISILHYLAWLIIWLLITIKSDWRFKFDQNHYLIDFGKNSKDFQACPIKKCKNKTQSISGHLFDLLPKKSEGTYTCFQGYSANSNNDNENIDNQHVGNNNRELQGQNQNSVQLQPLNALSIISGSSENNSITTNNSRESSSRASSSVAHSNNNNNTIGSRTIRYVPVTVDSPPNHQQLQLQLQQQQQQQQQISNDFSPTNIESNYDDITMATRFSSRSSTRTQPLKNISEERSTLNRQIEFGKYENNGMGDYDYFKSPNVSQHSSTMPSSDSGIGGYEYQHQKYAAGPSPLIPQPSLSEELVMEDISTGVAAHDRNMCSDV